MGAQNPAGGGRGDPRAALPKQCSHGREARGGAGAVPDGRMAHRRPADGPGLHCDGLPFPNPRYPRGREAGGYPGGLRGSARVREGELAEAGVRGGGRGDECGVGREECGECGGGCVLRGGVQGRVENHARTRWGGEFIFRHLVAQRTESGATILEADQDRGGARRPGEVPLRGHLLFPRHCSAGPYGDATPEGSRPHEVECGGLRPVHLPARVLEISAGQGRYQPFHPEFDFPGGLSIRRQDQPADHPGYPGSYVRVRSRWDPAGPGPRVRPDRQEDPVRGVQEGAGRGD
mmetsp:Transcript_58533/g.128342  ORF Transcript_58533/g.128342 Transcript_58533/m.128342 type:complete len:291 (+) Transcript_58533:546-1418(+)